MIYDFIIIGSGVSGVQAAQTLIESGAKVAMIDVGIQDDYYKKIIPNKDFIFNRENDSNQHEYFLGKDFEGIPWGHNRVGSQLTPPRNFIIKEVSKLTPLFSESFAPMESLAIGGLGSGWGCGCYVFSGKELEAIGLDAVKMKEAYNVIASRIGISGLDDDGMPYSLATINKIQAPQPLQKSMKGILEKYTRKREKLNKKGIYLGRAPLAVLSEDLGDRKKTSYHDMDFWGDHGKSAYRSWITLEELMKNKNFSYHPNCLALKFVEQEEQVDVAVKRIDTKEELTFNAKKLLLATGVLGTSRIVARSFDYKVEKLPIISNPYTYIPCLQWRMLGKEVERYKTSFAQLMIYLDEQHSNFDVSVASLFSYRSLLLFKLVKEMPLNFADSRIIMQYLQSSFIIAGLHHPEQTSKNKFIKLEKDRESFTGDRLTATYLLSEEEKNANRQKENKVKRALNTLGCFPLKTFQTPAGGSIHYAGSLPFSTEDKPFTLAKNGKLNGTKNVFVADGSGFKYLPAKGLTLTLMANAHNVARQFVR